MPADAASDLLEPAVAVTARRPKLLFLITEDWYFWSHRLTLARTAREAGFDVAVATRVDAHGERIRAEGFRLYPLRWRRNGDGLAGGCRAIAEIARVYRAERPDILHHVALKAVLFGAAACRLAFFRGTKRPAVLSAVMGLGWGFAGTGLAAGIRRAVLRRAVRWAMRASPGLTVKQGITQNPEDRAVLAGLGVDPGRIALIRGSGVDIGHFAVLPEPPGPGVTVALVARMLKTKGVPDAAEAIRRLRARGVAVELLLAGSDDPANPDSLTVGELQALAAEPGITWLGRVEDVREVWRRAAVAVFPSVYGEGLPKSLLEAAACGRPIVAVDIPGTREIARPGESGILVPPGDVAALAEAIAALTGDPARRRELGDGGRTLVEREFADDIIAGQTVALYRTLLGERDNKK